MRHRPIAPDLPPLRPDDTIGRALDWMEEFKVRHLPVTSEGRLVGLVQDTALVDRNDPNAPVSSVMEQVEVPFVRDGQHIYEVMKVMSERGLSVLPVLDPTGHYLGALERARGAAPPGGGHQPARTGQRGGIGDERQRLQPTADRRHRGGQRRQIAQCVQPHFAWIGARGSDAEGEPRGDQ
ncbi:MAG: CBS domain-containing protein [Flavobacteriales bacterium]|nr:CBS domain-containing protein [Flavobacteriales bacterium]